MGYERDEPSGAMPDKYDRALGMLAGLPGMARTKPTTIRVTPPLGIGGSSTYVVTTYRQAGDIIDDERNRRAPPVFTVALEIIEGDRAMRIILPNDVANLIARQRDGLTTLANKKRARQAAATRTARGIRTGFTKRK